MLKVKLIIGCGYAGVPSAEMEVKYDGTKDEFDRDQGAAQDILNLLTCGGIGDYNMDIETEEVPDEDNDYADPCEWIG